MYRNGAVRNELRAINRGMYNRPEAVAARAALAALPGQQEAQRTLAYNQQGVDQARRGAEEDARRNNALSELDAAYANPNRTTARNQLYDAQLGDQVAGLQYGFGQQSQKAGLNAARRGRLGSSYDAETQGGLQAGLQGNVMAAQNQAANQRSNMEAQDRQQHEQLRRSIMGTNGLQTAANQQLGYSYGQESEGILRQAQNDARLRQESDQDRLRNYQTVGNVAGSVGRGVYNYYGV